MQGISIWKWDATVEIDGNSTRMSGEDELRPRATPDTATEHLRGLLWLHLIKKLGPGDAPHWKIADFSVTYVKTLVV